jgi:hypothetical protein
MPTASVLDVGTVKCAESEAARSFLVRSTPAWAQRRADCKMCVHAGSGWLHGASALPGLLQGSMTGAQQLHSAADSHTNPEAKIAWLWSLPSAPFAPGAPGFQPREAGINHNYNTHPAGAYPIPAPTMQSFGSTEGSSCCLACQPQQLQPPVPEPAHLPLAMSLPSQTLMTEAVPAVEIARSTSQQQQSQTLTWSSQLAVEAIFSEPEECSYSINQLLEMPDF